MADTQDPGWLNNTQHCPSPNYNERPDASDIRLLVVHNISLPPGEFGGPHIKNFFCNRLACDEHPYFQTLDGLEVSAHFLIERCGKLVQFVPLQGRAWHAGQSSYGGEPNCNDFSVGVELEGCDDQPYTQAQYQTLARLSADLVGRYPGLSAAGPCAQSRVPGLNICGHSDIAPGRKTDPGDSFDWVLYQTYLESSVPG